MVEHAFDDQHMQGEFQPEDGQRLLAQIRHCLQSLARLAPPGTTDDISEGRPGGDMLDLAIGLEHTATQLERVLQALSRRQPAGTPPAAESPHAQTDQDWTAQADSDETEADDEPLTFGVTLSQFDQLQLLVAGIKAFGDAVFADVSADFAAGTLSMLGFTIFDRAEEVNDILMEIEAQSLPEPARRDWSVKETAPAYGLAPARRRTGGAMKVKDTPGVYAVSLSQPEALRLH
jgi:hypothetical protein